MQYQKIEEHKAVPVTDVMIIQKKKLTELINGTDRFWTGYQEAMPEGKIFVSLRTPVPFQIQKEMYLFNRVEIVQWYREGISKQPIETPSKDLIKELLEEIGLRHLYDEDSPNRGILTKEETDSTAVGDKAYCYVNVDMPNAYWENHMLETRYVTVI